jgi:hypothetical protein
MQTLYKPEYCILLYPETIEAVERRSLFNYMEESFLLYRLRDARDSPPQYRTGYASKKEATSCLKLMHELQLSKTLCPHEHKRSNRCLSEHYSQT